MIVNKKGRYKVLQDFPTKTALSISIIEKDTIIEITQIDESHHKVIGKELFDWTYWDLPVEVSNE